MHWHKRGLIYAPSGEMEWSKSHAAIPTALQLSDERYRIYFSTRDERNRARIGFVDLDIDDPLNGQQVATAPSLGLGELGTFDDGGVTTSCVVPVDGSLYHYYTGWSLGVTVPFYFYGGLAVSTDGGLTFERISEAPILERNTVDPFLTASPWVMRDAGRWRMWYISCTGWEKVNGAPRHKYHIRYAESHNGIAWDRRGVVCIDYATPEEYAFARPVVVKDENRYKMWFCVRGPAYRMGYAESSDGITWERDDSCAGIDVSPQGWDSEMIAYGNVIEHKGATYLLYNGNGYGKTGFGYAVAE